LIIDLIELAREIDVEWQRGHLTKNQLGSYAVKENLWLVALLNSQGDIIFNNRSIPNDLLSLARPVIHGYEEIKIHIFDHLWSSLEIGFIALRRKSGEGTIILALDNGGIRYWGLKASIQRAIAEVGQAPGAVYFIVMDQQLNVLGQAGDPPEMDKIEASTKNILKQGTGISSRKIVVGGQNLLEIQTPIHFMDGFEGIARLGLTRDTADQILKKSRVRVFISIAFMVVIAFLSMWFLYKNQNRHLAKMREIEKRLYKAERLSALGRLAAGVAHEIRNPLNAISIASQRLQNGNLHQLTEVIRNEINRLNHIIEEFLSFSKNRKLEFHRRDLTDLLDQIVLLIRDEAESEGVTIQTFWKDSHFIISMDFDKLKQALFNIIKNAMESISDKGTVSLYAEPKDKKWVCVRISDTGAGLSPEKIEHIFDLDYTTKIKGLGLGLPIANEIIRGHGGEIHVSSREGTGTTFNYI
jgi:signal transduction histidine kinase